MKSRSGVAESKKQFEDIKGVMRRWTDNTMIKRKNNDLQNTTQKTKY
jgi:hypothetical protein